jgi:hypothetical protein
MGVEAGLDLLQFLVRFPLFVQAQPALGGLEVALILLVERYQRLYNNLFQRTLQ